MAENLVIVNQSGGHMDIDVANLAIERYDRVVMLGNFKAVERRLDKRVESENIIRFNKSSTIKRLWTWGIGSLQVFWKLLVHYRGWSVLYYTNPPMACWASLVLPNKFSIMEYDIYPDALKTIGISERNVLSRLWGRINSRLLKKADKVYTLSEGMKTCLAKYCDIEKIKVVPLWSASSDFRPLNKEENPFIIEHALKDKFIVMYSGNIGYTHSVEVLVEVAKVMKDDSNIHFLIIGEGKKKGIIDSEVKKCGLENVTLLPYQSIQMLPYSLSSADLGVITLDENVSKVSVPSKTFNLMAVGAPLLAISNEDTEMFNLIHKYQNGRCIPKNNIRGMVEYIRELKNNSLLREHYGNNSLKASKDFTYKNARFYFE